MILLFQIVLSLIFLGLAGLHFLWAAGFLWGFEKALPRKLNGSFLFYPKKIESFGIGAFLLCLSIFYFLQTGFIQISINERITSVISWIIIGVFAIRSIGEFKYVGFTKRIKNSEFAKLDSLYYSPLCVLIAVLAFVIL